MPSSNDPTSSTPEAPALIGVDWGTSSCRAYLMTATGAILETVDTDDGILKVAGGAFAETLDALVGAWRQPGLPVILSGMIGSRQGWIEAPYVPTPASFDAIAGALVRHPDDSDIRIAPGLAQDLPEQPPDVMRGEETQIIGAASDTSERQLLVMPGTHSKWVVIEERTVVRFATFMTGELFAVLKDHSILGRLMTEGDDAEDESAFARGLDVATTTPGGLLRHLFSARTLALFNRLPENAVAAYLSGLLIGHELSDAFAMLERPANPPPITIIGASALSGRYITALRRAGFDAQTAGGHTAASGHHQLARVAGLLPSRTERTA